MSLKALSDFTFVSRYSQHVDNSNRRETWSEAIDRKFGMHEIKYREYINTSPELKQEIEFAKKQVLKKRVLGSQRSLQFGGYPILDKNERIYNCSSLYIDKPKSFQDCVYLLLCGCGVGFSVQNHHIGKLPYVAPITGDKITYVIPDTIEGWADSVGVLLSSYFVDGGFFPEYKGKEVEFDFSKIREKGSLIAKKFKAPGPEPLKNGLEKIRKLLNQATKNGVTKLRAIQVYDIIMHSADFVISGGVRRSATICLFSKEDEEMAKAKTGGWFIDNPQRARSNNSVHLVRNDVTKEEFDKIFESIKHFGEPGFYFADDKNVTTNPCVEISFYNELEDGRTGVCFCNLCEINGKFCNTEENFYQACRAAAIIGTLQAGYTDFPYLGETTEELVKREALLGVSITGWMDSPDILFNPEILKKGAEIVKETNQKIANLININPSARVTCSKPAGHTSCILGTASGIHPHHSRRYIRRVQCNKQEIALQAFKQHNPIAVEESIWSANKSDDVVSFPCEVPSGSITKNQLSAIDFLDKVKLAQEYWVKTGTTPERGIKPFVHHNVSNTITVMDDEWDSVRDYIYENRDHFTGISLLSSSGDLDYNQAPFVTVLTPMEMVKEYGDAQPLASGLIVDGLHSFGDLWEACASALGYGEKVPELEDIKFPETGYPIDHVLFQKADWIRRLRQFANRYFNDDLRKATYCLKHVATWKQWCDLRREYTEVDWTAISEDQSELVDISSTAGVACSGNACVINF